MEHKGRRSVKGRAASVSMCVWEDGGMVRLGVGWGMEGWGVYSLWCHLRKVLGPVKLSEWMECFFRRPRSTFFHRRTSVCLFLFQIHSIIPTARNIPGHSRSPTFLFFHSNQDHQPPPLSPPTLTPAPTQTSFFFPSSFLIVDGRGPPSKKRPSRSLFPPC